MVLGIKPHPCLHASQELYSPPSSLAPDFGNSEKCFSDASGSPIVKFICLTISLRSLGCFFWGMKLESKVWGFSVLSAAGFFFSCSIKYNYMFLVV